MRNLVASLVLLLAGTASAAQPLDGQWSGLLDAGAQKLRLVITLRHQGATWTGELASPDQHVSGIPADRVTVDGDKLTFDIARLGAHYEGRRGADDHIRGTFTQGGPLPLELVRGELPPPSPSKRPQTPRPPFPYDEEQVTVDNAAAKVKLGCTFAHPRGAKHVPALVMITGSGAQDRDETLFEHKPFAVLSDALVRAGAAVLRCDDRGVGQSTGNFLSATTFDFAGDAQASLAWLRARPEVDRARVGLLGHSEGGTIAAIVASRTHDVAFVIMMAGMALRGDETIALQSERLQQASGASAEQVKSGVDLQRKLLAIVERDKDDAVAEADIRALAAQAGMPPDALVAQARSLLTPWYRTLLTLDPKVYLRQVKVPLLALDGERDMQVPPKQNLAAVRAALAGNRDATVRELPGLNHLFQQCQTGLPDEYGKLEQTLNPLLIDSIVSWMRQHMLRSAP